MKYILLALLIIATPLISAGQFDGKYKVCELMNRTTPEDCDNFWINITHLDVGNFTIFDHTWNLTKIEDDLKNYSEFVVKNFSDSFNFSSLNETRVKEIISNTTFQLNMTSIGNSAKKEIDNALKENAKITTAIENKFDSFQNEIPTLTLINSVVLLIFIVGLVIMMIKNKEKDEFPKQPKY